jgi:hypothetical protein
VRSAHRPAPNRSQRILAGARARARIEREGLAATDISALAGAAGGPEGLVFLPLDEHLFGAWLPRAPRPRLLAGASICAWRMAAPVRDPAGAPAGTYWDGGLIDHHLFLDWRRLDWRRLDWRRLDGLVPYPHFTPHLTSGWLDKGLPWRRGGLRGAAAWLPNRKLPDRRDFAHDGLDHDRRLRDWRRAIGGCRRLVDEFEAFCPRPDPRPDPRLVEPLERAP